MRAMLHRRWTRRFSDYLDGALPEAERARVLAHVEGCPGCRRVLDELERVVTAAGRLEPVTPPRDLWPGIETLIRERAGAQRATAGGPRGEESARGARSRHGLAPDVIALPTVPAGAAAAARNPGRRGRIALTAPQLAAAAAALVVLSVAATRWVTAPVPADATQRSFADPIPALEVAADLPAPPAGLAAELSALERELAGAREAIDANTLRVLRRNMAVIERAIEDSRRALAVDPGNEFLSRHLEQVYERKLDYLRQAAAIVDWTD